MTRRHKVRETFDLKSAVKSKDALVQDLEIELRRYRDENQSQDPAFVELRRMRDELIELEQKQESYKRDVEAAEEALDIERRAVQKLTISFREEKARNTSLNEANKRIDDELKEAKTQLFNQKNRLQARNADQDTSRVAVQEKNQELNRYMAEIQMLSTENNQMALDMESMTFELEAAIGELERNTNELDDTRALIQENDETIQSLTDERDALRIKLADLSDQLHEETTVKGSLADLLQDQKNDKEELARQMEHELENTKTELFKVTTDLQVAKNEIASSPAESLRKELHLKDEQLKNLNSKLDESKAEFELLCIDWDRLDQLVSKKSDAGNLTLDTIKGHLTGIGKLKDKIEVYKTKRHEDIETIKSLNGQLVQKDVNILELNEKVQLYEQGQYGLQEAVRELKSSNLQKSIRDRDIAELTQKINDFQAQATDLAEENGELRLKLGLDATQIDLSNLKKLKTVELEKSRSLNVQYKKEIDRLEEERLALKSTLRLQAMDRGERAINLGLTAQDLAAVEDSAAKLRVGDSKSKTVVERPVVANTDLDKIVVELERTHVDGIETRERLRVLELQLRKREEDNRQLENALQELATALVDGNEGKELPVLEKLVFFLESRHGYQDKGEETQGVSVAKQSMLRLHQNLRNELKACTIERDRLSNQNKTLFGQIEDLKLEKKGLQDAIINKSKSRILDLPSELTMASIHGYTSLVEQLIECISDLQRKEMELCECQDALQSFRDKYVSHTGRLQHLYKEYHILKTSNANEVEALKQRLVESEKNVELANIRANSAERAANALAGSPDEIRNELLSAERRVIILEVNEHKLRRLVDAMTFEGKLHRKQIQQYKKDVMELDAAARETISRIYLQKRQGLLRIEQLETQLKHSVPRVEYDLLDNKAEMTLMKLRLLTERETQWIEERNDQDTLLSEYHKLRAEFERLKIQFDEAKNKASGFEQALLDHTKISTAADSLVLRHQLISTQVHLEMEIKKREFAESQASSFTQLEANIKSQLKGMENMYMNAKEETLRLQEEKLAVLNDYQGGATREENQKNTSLLQSLREEVMAMETRVVRYKDTADIATNQVADLIYHHKSDQTEKGILRAAIQEMQMEDDENLVIGKLHHHILTLQVSEAMALRKLESFQSKTLRLESNVVDIENQLDARDRTIFETRFECRKRIHHLQKMVSTLRLKFGGMVLFEKHERACDTVRSLEEKRRELQITLAETQASVISLEDKVAESDLKLAQQIELFDVLRNPTTSQSRVIAWSDKMSMVLAADLKLQRDLDRTKKELADVQGDLCLSDAAVQELDERMLAIQTEFDSSQLTWEKRQEELENIVQQFELERDEIFQSFSADEAQRLLPDRNLPIGQQLEQALRMLLERTKLLKSQEHRLVSVDEELKSLKSKAHFHQSMVLKKDEELSHLQSVMAESGPAESIVAEITKSLASKDAQMARMREQQTVAIAQDTIESLQMRLDQRNELVDKYRNMLKSIRKEVAHEKEKERLAMDVKNAELDSLTSQHIQHLKLQ